MSIWEPYAPTQKQPWNWQRVVHLHRRAAFGAAWKTIERDITDGHDAAIERILQGEPNRDGTNVDELSPILADAAIRSGDANRLKAWWLFRMMFSPFPLQEKITLLWHNHFATSNLKVRDLNLMIRQNELLRKHAFGSFRQMLPAVVKDAAMLTWLDASLNRKGKPNENLARELMELFTLGVGNYSENDVKQAAKALTGWTTRRDQFHWKAERHETGEKTILGQTESFQGDDLLNLLLDHPATSHRLAWRLCRCFFGENVVTEQAIESLAKGLRANNLNIGWAVATIIKSKLFFSDVNINSRVSSPVEFMMHAIHALELTNDPPSTVVLSDWSDRMGQSLFYPPNVGGWNEGRSWINSRTIIARSNFAVTICKGQLQTKAKVLPLDQLPAKYGCREGLDSKTRFFSRLLLGTDLHMADERLSETLQAVEEKWPESPSVNRLVATLLSLPQSLVT